MQCPKTALMPAQLCRFIKLHGIVYHELQIALDANYVSTKLFIYKNHTPSRPRTMVKQVCHLGRVTVGAVMGVERPAYQPLLIQALLHVELATPPVLDPPPYPSSSSPTAVTFEAGGYWVEKYSKDAILPRWTRVQSPLALKYTCVLVTFPLL